MRYFAVLLLVSASLFSSTTLANEDSIPESARRYYRALAKRPTSDSLFTRFVSAWIEAEEPDTLEAFLSENSEQIGNHFLLARFYQTRNERSLANSAWKSLTNTGSAPLKMRCIAQWNLSQNAFQENKFDEALRFIQAGRKLLSEQPDPELDVKLARFEGRILIRTSKREQGLTVLKELVERHPDDLLLKEDVVTLLSELRMQKEAITVQESIIESLQSDPYARTLAEIELGTLCLNARLDERAITIWTDALSSSGAGTWVERESLGLITSALRRRDKLTELRDHLGTLYAANPARAAVGVEKAKVLTDLREETPALETWRDLLRRNPGDRDLREQFVLALSQLEKPKEAITQMEQLVEQHPEDSTLLASLAELHHEAGDQGAAVITYQRYLENSDPYESTWLQVARRFSEWRKTEEADALFEKMQTQFAESSSVLESYAVHLYDTDRKPRAVQMWQDLGNKGDLRDARRAAFLLQNRFETDAAFELLENRYEEFQLQPEYLEALIRAALLADQPEKGFSWSLESLALRSENGTFKELQDAVQQSVRAGRAIEPSCEKALAELASHTSGEKGHEAFTALRVSLLAQSGREMVAIEELEAQEDPGLLLLGTLSSLYQRQNEWTKAAAVLIRSLPLAAELDKVERYREIATLYERADDPTAALEWVQKWKIALPGDEDAWLREVNLLKERGEIRTALRQLKEATGLFPDNTRIKENLSTLYTEAGYKREAIETLWTLYDSTDDFWIRRRWIGSMIELSSDDDLRKSLTKAFARRAQENPQSTEAALAHAEILERFGNREQFLDELLRASRIDPKNIAVLHKLASHYESRGDYNAAMTQLKLAAASDRTLRSVQRIARLHVLRGDLEAAIQQLDSLPSGIQSTPTEALSFASQLLQISDWEKAETFLRKKTEAHPTHAGLAYYHAISLRELRRYPEAIEAFSRVLDFDESYFPVSANSANTSVNFFASTISFSPGVPQWQLPHSQTTFPISQWITGFNMATRYRGVKPEQSVFRIVGGHNYGFGFSNQGSSPIFIPTDPVTAKGAASRHLLEIFSVTAADSIEGELTELGIPGRKAELATALWQAQNGDTAASHRFIEKYSSDAEIAGHFFRTFYLENKESPVVETLLETVREKEGNEYALGLALQTDRLDLILDLAEREKLITDHLVISLERMRSEPGSSLTPPQNERIDRLLSKWVPKFDGRSNEFSRANAFASLLMHRKRHSTEAWTRFFLQTWEKALTFPEEKFVPLGNFGHPPSLPLPAVPDWLSHSLNESTMPDADPESYFSLTKHPIPGALLLLKQKPTPAIEKLLPLLESEEHHQPIAALLRAALLAHFGRYNEASELAVSLRDQLNSEYERNRLDYFLFKLASHSEEDEALRTKAIAAAKRMRLSRELSLVVNWDEIAAIVESWGKNEISARPAYVAAADQRARARLQQTNFRPPINYYASRSWTYPTASFPAQIQLPDLNALTRQIEPLLESKDTEAVAEIVSSQLPLITANLLSQRQELLAVVDQYRRIASSIEEAKLTDELLKRTRPKEDSGPISQYRYATILAMHKRFPEARAAYESLLDQEPEHPTILSSQITALAKTDLLAAMNRILEKHESLDITSTMNVIAQLANEDLAKTLDFVDSILKRFPELTASSTPEKVDPGYNSYGRNRLYWITTIVDRLERLDRAGGEKIPRFFTQDQKFDRSRLSAPLRAQLDELFARRLASYRELCLKGFGKDRNVDSHLFPRLVFLHEIGEIEEATLSRLAIQASEELVASHPRSVSWSMPHTPPRERKGEVWQWQIREGRGVTSIAPTTWLIENNHLPDVKKFLNERLLPSADSITLPNGQPSTELVLRLYSCEPSSFKPHFQELLSQASHPDHAFQLLRRLRFVRPELDEHLSLDSFVMENVEHFTESDSLRRLALEALTTLAVENGQDGVANFLTKLETELFPDRDALVQSIEKDSRTKIQTSSPFHSIAWQGRPSSRNSLSWKVQRFNQFLEGLYQDSNLVWEVWRFAEARGYNKMRSSTQLRALNESVRRDDTQDLEILLSEILGAAAKDFPLIPKRPEERESGTASQMGDFLVRLKHHFRGQEEKSTYDGLKKLLTQHDTFGSELIGALLAPNRDDQVVDVFDKYIGEIHELPEKERGLFSDIAFSLVNPNQFQEPLTDDERATFRSLSRENTYLLRDTLTRYKNAETIDDLNLNNPEQFVSQVSDTLAEMIGWDWQAAFEAFPNLVRIGNEAAREGRLRLDTQSPGEQILNRATRDAPAGALVAFVASALALDGEYAIFPNTNYSDILDSRFRNSKRESETNTEYFRRFRRFLSEIRAELPDEANEGVIAAFFLSLLEQSDERTDLALAWAEDKENQLLSPLLSAALHRVADFLQNEDSSEITGRQAFEPYARRGTTSERAFFQYTFCLEFRNDTSLYAENSDLLTECWQKTFSVNSYVTNRFFLVLSKHGQTLPTKEGWFNLADGFAKTHFAGGGGSEGRVRNFNFDQVALEFLFEIQSQQKDPAKVNALYQEFEEGLSKDLANEFVYLVRGKKFDFAEHLLRHHPREIVLGRIDRNQEFDALMGMATKQFLSRFAEKDRDQEALAAFAIYRLSDPQAKEQSSDGHLPSQNKSARFLEFINRYPLELIEDKELRDLIIVTLYREPELRPILSKHIAMAPTSLPFLEIVKLDREQRFMKLELLGNILVKEKEKGETESWESVLAEIRKIEPERTRTEFTNWSIDLYRKTFEEDIIAGKIDASAFPLWLATLRNIERSKVNPWNEVRHENPNFGFIKLLDAFLFHTKKNQEVEALLSQLTKEDRRTILVERDRPPPGFHDKIATTLPFSKTGDDGERNKSKEDCDATIAIIRSLERASDCGFKGSYFRELAAHKLAEIRPLHQSTYFYLHCCDIVSREQENDDGYSFYYWGGWSFSSHLLERANFLRIITPDPPDLADDVMFQLDLFWGFAPDDLTVNTSSSYNYRRRFAHILEQNGGDLFARKCLLELLENLPLSERAVRDRGNHITAQLLFFEVCQALNIQKEVAEHMEFALTLYQETGNPYALEFAMAARFWLAVYSHDYQWNTKVSEPDSWDAHVIRALRDETLSLPVRNGIAWHFLLHGKDHCSQALKMKAIEICADTADSKHKVPQNNFACHLRHFHELPESEWKAEMGKQLLAGWDHQLRFNDENIRKSRSYRPSTNTVLAAFELHLQFADPDKVQNFYKQFEKQLLQTPSTFSLLLRHQEFEIAEEWMKQSLAGDCFDFHFRNDLWIRPYDSELAKSLTAFLPRLESEAARYRASALIEAVPDPVDASSHSKQIAFETRSRRLAAAAQKYEQFSQALSGDEQNQILRLLTLESTSIDQFSSDFRNRLYKDEWPLFYEHFSDSKIQEVRSPLLPALAISEALAGNPNSLFEIASRKDKNDGKSLSRQQRVAIVDSLTRLFDDHLRKAVETGDYARAGKLATSIAKIADEVKDQPGQLTQLYLIYRTASVVSGVSSPETPPVFHEICEFDPDRDGYEFVHFLVGILDLHLAENRKRYAELRWNIATAFLSDPILQKGFESHYKEIPILLHFVEHHLLSPEEIVARESEIRNLWPESTPLALEVAKVSLLHGATETASAISQQICDLSFDGPSTGYSREKRRHNEKRARAVYLLFESGSEKAAKHEMETFFEGVYDETDYRYFQNLKSYLDSKTKPDSKPE